ncbi:MAG: HAD family hydrolase [Methyloversatilis sp.]|nr:HAD family hydrolase [Methyloversatilis sp.]MBP6195846.1 HAD family hydrolase [Methyloversatilis sp.]
MNEHALRVALTTVAPPYSAASTPRPAVFIDQGGTLVEKVPYNADPALLRFKPSACEAMAMLASAGLPLVLVSNQSGIGRGYFTRGQFSALQSALERRLRDEAGVELTDFVICPHVPAAGGQPACLCRKPAPGMLVRAARAHRIDLSASWMVGDKLDDVEAGRRAGCRTVLLDDGGETVWRRSPLRIPHARCVDWPSVSRLILADRSGLRAAAMPPAVTS